MVMSAVGLLARQPRLSREQIRQALPASLAELWEFRAAEPGAALLA